MRKEREETKNQFEERKESTASIDAIRDVRKTILRNVEVSQIVTNIRSVGKILGDGNRHRGDLVLGHVKNLQGRKGCEQARLLQVLHEVLNALVFYLTANRQRRLVRTHPEDVLPTPLEAVNRSATENHIQ